METYGWGQDYPVADWLFAEGYRFDFYQAVKLLEIFEAGSNTASVGAEADPNREVVRFHSKVRLDFPASAVEDLEEPEYPDDPWSMTINFLSLAGVFGPLPIPYTELILERNRKHDTAFQDFLDIFNHRLVSLMYRVRKHHRMSLVTTSPDQSHFAKYLYSFIGLNTPGLLQRMQVKDRSLLYYTGLFSQQPHSAVALECLLSDYFQVKIRVQQFLGEWCDLESDQRTYIGRTGQNQYLGQGAVLGKRVWFPQNRFRLQIGPVDLKSFLDFLPIGRGYHPLCELARFFTHQEYEFDLRLKIRAKEVPESRIGAMMGPRLGWTSWLKRHEFPEDDSQVRLPSHDHPPGLDHLYAEFFSQLTTTELSIMVQKMEKHSFPPNTIILRQEEKPTSFFVIAQGVVQATTQDAEGHPIPLATLKAGDFFGETSVITGKTRQASITTLEPSQIWEMKLDHLEQLLVQYPAMQRVFRDPEAEARGATQLQKLKSHLPTIFTKIVETELIELLSQSQQIELPENTTIIRQGERSTSLYLVAQGSVNVFRDTPRERRFIKAVEAGEFFGEIAFLTCTLRTGTVVTAEPTELWKFSRNSFRYIIQKYPEVEHALKVFYEHQAREIPILQPLYWE